MQVTKAKDNATKVADDEKKAKTQEDVVKTEEKQAKQEHNDNTKAAADLKSDSAPDSKSDSPSSKPAANLLSLPKNKTAMKSGAASDMLKSAGFKPAVAAAVAGAIALLAL